MTTRRAFIKDLAAVAAATAIAPAMAQAHPASKEKSYSLKKQKINLDSTWDVIVVGGGPGGCTAAIAAAREGARTLIIEASGKLGGMGTIGMVPAWTPFSDGERIVYGGLAKKIFLESNKGVSTLPEGKVDWVEINPEHLARVYDDMVSESGAKVLFFSRVAAVEKSANDTVEAVIVANQNGLTAFKAKVFIDATGDGNLCDWAGAEYKWGDEDGRVQLSTLCFSFANVNPIEYNQVHRLRTGAIRDVLRSKKYPRIDGHLCIGLIGPGVLQFNAGHMNIDPHDEWAVSEAMATGRIMAGDYLKALKEAYPDVFKDAFVANTASVIGTRDSRRVVGDYMLSVQDYEARRVFDDEIGRNCYYLDIHTGGHKSMHYGKGESHGIPYRCLTPKDLKNVLTAGRCISTDFEIFGSMRVMPPCLVTGEAAGMAAAHAITQCGNDVHKIDVDHLRKRLKEEGQYFL